MSRLIAVTPLVLFGILGDPWIQAQSPGPQPQFEVASIKLDTGDPGGSLTQPFPGGRLRVRNQSVRMRPTETVKESVPEIPHHVGPAARGSCTAV